jgi:hypothetical protein
MRARHAFSLSRCRCSGDYPGSFSELQKKDMSMKYCHLIMMLISMGFVACTGVVASPVDGHIQGGGPIRFEGYSISGDTSVEVLAKNQQTGAYEVIGTTVSSSEPTSHPDVATDGYHWTLDISYPGAPYVYGEGSGEFQVRVQGSSNMDVLGSNGHDCLSNQYFVQHLSLTTAWSTCKKSNAVIRARWIL